MPPRPPTRPPAAVTILALVVAMLGLAACGGGDDEPPVVAGEVVDLGDDMVGVGPTTDPVGIVLYLHGAGERAEGLATDPGKAGIIDALTTRGWAVAAADAGGNAWGDDGSLEDYRELHDAARERWPSAGPVVLWSVSMGGLPGLLTIAERPFPIAGWIGTMPVTDLSTMVDGMFAESIAEAYGDDPLNDPAAVPAEAFAGVPMLIVASAGDTVVPADRNAFAFAEQVGAVTTVEVVEVTGEHGDPSHFDPDPITAFLDRVLAGTP